MTAAPLMPEIDLDPHASADDVRAFFERDRLIAAYALADLDPRNVDQSRWWVARRGDDIVAAALLVEVLPFRPCFAMGESQALAELFRSGMTEARLILATPLDRAMFCGTEAGLPPAELERLADAGVRAFLAAYGAGGDGRRA